MLEASSSPDSTRLIATRAYQSSDLKHRREIQTQNTDLKHGPETGPANAQGTCGARLSSRRNRKRGSQGVDALYYTERTGTPSNKPCRSGWLDAAKPQLVTPPVLVCQLSVLKETGSSLVALGICFPRKRVTLLRAVGHIFSSFFQIKYTIPKTR